MIEATKVAAKFKCEDCAETFSSRNKMFSHIRDTHDKLEQDSQLDRNRFEVLNSCIVGSEIRTAGEDSSYRVVVKPQGLPTMGKFEEGRSSLMRSKELIIPGAYELNLPYKKAVPCHRLDSSTGGLVVCSKSRPAEVCIKMCFRQKLIHKRYQAIVPGRLEPKEGNMSTPIGGKFSLTKYSVVDYSRSARYGWISTVNCWPVTGRKHQIRRHLMSVGHAILGDKRYSHASMWPERIGGKELMFLWSLEVEFPHPINCNTEEENEIIRSENILKVLKEKEIMSRTPEVIKDSNIGDEVDDDDGNDEDACDTPAGVMGNGNTTSGGDMNSIENRLLISSGTQLREEMFGIEKRKNVLIVIDPPIYYETFRECHREEWKSIHENSLS